MYTPVCTLNVTAASFTSRISEVVSFRHGSEWGLDWSMEITNGGAMWTDYVVNVYCEKVQSKWNKNMPHVLNAVCTIYTPKFQTGYYFRKGMVVQQDFEKGRSQRLWFRRYDRYKN